MLCLIEFIQKCESGDAAPLTHKSSRTSPHAQVLTHKSSRTSPHAQVLTHKPHGSSCLGSGWPLVLLRLLPRFSFFNRLIHRRDAGTHCEHEEQRNKQADTAKHDARD